PAGTPSTVDGTVTTPNGTSTTNASDRYAYQTTQPQVNSVSPPSGPAAGGTSVTISGINLSGATAVKFGATPAASITASSATQVTAEIVTEVPPAAGPDGGLTLFTWGWVVW